MTVEQVKTQVSEYNRLTSQASQLAQALAVAALPNGTVTYEVKVVHKETGTLKETVAAAVITVNTASALTLLTNEQTDVDADVDAIETTFSTI